jgi:ankyrin repeat protein
MLHADRWGLLSVQVGACSYTDKTPLSSAAGNGHTEAVSFLLSQGAEVNKQSAQGESCPSGQARMARTWTDGLCSSCLGHTALYVASFRNNVEVIRLLLEAGGDPSLGTFRDHWTPEMVAAWKGHVEVLACLLRHDERQVDRVHLHSGYTALIWACQEGHTDCCRLLLEHGADPTVKTHKNMTARDWAVRLKRPACVEVLDVSVSAACWYPKGTSGPIEPGADFPSLPCVSYASRTTRDGAGCARPGSSIVI